MYSFFVGSDISKEVFDVSFHDGMKAVYLGQFDNNINGYKKAVKSLKCHTQSPSSSWFICFENTGIYSKALLEWLVSQDIPCREENALKISKSLGLRRGKNDKIDSIRICNYTFEKRDSIEPSTLPKPLIIRLKKLLGRRALLVKQRVAIELTLKEQKNFLDPDLADFFSQGNEDLIGVFNRQIKDIEALIKKSIDQDQQAKRNHKLAQSVIGIGPINSAYILAFTQNYSCFNDARKFACYSGVAPFPNQSGKSQRKSKVSHLANKKIKSLLSNAAVSAKVHDPQISSYYKKKIDEGKEKGLVINAIKNKLIHRVFCVIKRQTPYVKILAYA